MTKDILAKFLEGKMIMTGPDRYASINKAGAEYFAIEVLKFLNAGCLTPDGREFWIDKSITTGQTEVLTSAPNWLYPDQHETIHVKEVKEEPMKDYYFCYACLKNYPDTYAGKSHHCKPIEFKEPTEKSFYEPPVYGPTKFTDPIFDKEVSKDSEPSASAKPMFETVQGYMESDYAKADVEPKSTELELVEKARKMIKKCNENYEKATKPPQKDPLEAKVDLIDKLKLWIMFDRMPEIQRSHMQDESRVITHELDVVLSKITSLKKKNH